MYKNILKTAILSIFVTSTVFFIGIGNVLAATAPTCSVVASPSNINQGGSSSISWSSSNATSAYITNIGSVSPIGGARTVSPTIGSVSTSGARIISPSLTTTYTGTFIGAGGSVTCSATVYVSIPTPAPSCTLTASPSNITSGNSSTLSWSSSNATLATINQNIGSVSLELTLEMQLVNLAWC